MDSETDSLKKEIGALRAEIAEMKKDLVILNAFRNGEITKQLREADERARREIIEKWDKEVDEIPHIL